MKIKEIQPGMIIGCQDDTEVIALLWYLEILGYRWLSGQRPTEWKGALCFRAFQVHGDGHITYNAASKANIMFSDLIEQGEAADSSFDINAVMDAIDEAVELFPSDLEKIRKVLEARFNAPE